MMTNLLSEDEKLLAAGYVLGDLNPDELQQFEQKLTQNPALLAEVNALQASLRILPQALPMIAPPSELRQKIMAASGLSSSALPNFPAVWFPERQPSWLSFSWAKMIAMMASLGALVLGVDNLRLRQSLSNAPRPDTQTVANLLQHPNSRLVSLLGKGNSAAGTLLFTPGKWQEVVVSLGNLPPLPPEQVYRMWLTLKNGQVLPCGEFTTNSQGTVFIKINPTKTPPKGVKATGVFVTIDSANASLEPRGGQVVTGKI
jgi:anti-sigma-K factor RskA